MRPRSEHSAAEFFAALHWCCQLPAEKSQAGVEWFRARRRLIPKRFLIHFCLIPAENGRAGAFYAQLTPSRGRYARAGAAASTEQLGVRENLDMLGILQWKAKFR